MERVESRIEGCCALLCSQIGEQQARLELRRPHLDDRSNVLGLLLQPLPPAQLPLLLCLSHQNGLLERLNLGIRSRALRLALLDGVEVVADLGAEIGNLGDLGVCVSCGRAGTARGGRG